MFAHISSATVFKFLSGFLFAQVLLLVGVLTYRNATREIEQTIDTYVDLVTYEPPSPPPRPELPLIVPERNVPRIETDDGWMEVVPPTPKPKVIESKPWLAPDPPVTKSEYDRVRSGMTLREVQDVIGFKGEQMAETEFMGTHSEIWSWANEDGSNMNVQFLDGKSHTKAQFGLK